MKRAFIVVLVLLACGTLASSATAGLYLRKAEARREAIQRAKKNARADGGKVLSLWVGQCKRRYSNIKVGCAYNYRARLRNGAKVGCTAQMIVIKRSRVYETYGRKVNCT